MSSKRKAEATRWFRQAEYDLKAARWNITVMIVEKRNADRSPVG